MRAQLVTAVLACPVSSTLLAETPASISNGVDVKGVQHFAKEYRGTK
jgi:hypothetical protein